MLKKEIVKLILGFRQFRERFYSGENTIYSKLSHAPQAPKTLIIGCSDSRVDPSLLSSAGPGEIFVVRNVANLVPPYEADGGRHGVSAAIEFAVVNLKVQNVIVLGHRQCGGIRALLQPEETRAGIFVSQWMSIAATAKERTLASTSSEPFEVQWRCCELESIRNSIENLRSFPFIQDAIRDRELNLMGLYFDLETGELLELNEEKGKFQTLPL